MRGPRLLLLATCVLLAAGCVEPTDPLPTDGGPVPPVSGLHRLVVPGLNVTLDESVPTFALRGIGAEAYEPTMGVTSSGTLFVVAGTDIRKSTDLGQTWTSTGPSAGSASLPPTTLDPMLYVDPVTDRVFADQLYVGCSWLYWSDDEGETWTHNPAACGLPGDDHQTIATGSTALSSLYEGRAFYFCANQFADATCAVSLDGGRTFPITRPVFAADDARDCGGITGHITTGPDGTAFLPAWRCDEPWLGISRDSGQTWKGLRVSEKSSGGMDPSISVASDGSLYYFWMETNGHPWLTTSKDGGETWSAPVDVAFPGFGTGSLPSIVAGDNGRIAMTYIATADGKTQDPQEVPENTTWNLYVTLSLDALAAEPHFTTVQLNPPGDPVHRGGCSGGYRCGDIVDFMDIVMGPDGRVYVSSVDACGTATCIGKEAAADATKQGEGLLGVLLDGPSLKADVDALEAT